MHGSLQVNEEIRKILEHNNDKSISAAAAAALPLLTILFYCSSESKNSQSLVVFY